MQTRYRILAALATVLLVAVAAAPALAETGPPASEYDPAVAAMIERIDASGIYRTAADLQGIPTRVYPSPGNRQAADYLYERLTAIPGLEVEYQDDRYRNVVATLPGRGSASGEAIAVGAHYDSASSDPDRAPGATDDGAGVATVLELARVMSAAGFDRTVRFAFWNAEETGLDGSAAYVRDAAEESMVIPLYLNYDGAFYDPEAHLVLDVLANEESAPFAEALARCNDLYGTGFELTENVHDCGSDHESFWAGGYPAISTHAEEHAPGAHSPEDTVELIPLEYARKNAQLRLALLAATAGPAPAVATPVPVTAPPADQATPTVPPAAPSGPGKWYAVGDPGSFLDARASPGNAPVATPRATVTPGPALEPWSRPYGVGPPSGGFVRWYPAARWKAGIASVG